MINERLYRMTNRVGAQFEVDTLCEQGDLVPYFRHGKIVREAILLVESITPTDNGWEETAGLRAAIGETDHA